MANDSYHDEEDLPLVVGSVTELPDGCLEAIEIVNDGIAAKEANGEKVVSLDAYRSQMRESMYRDFHAGHVAGLNEWASRLVSGRTIKCWRKTVDRYPDGRTEETALIPIFEDIAKKEESGFFPGIGGSPMALHKYTFRNGETCFEFLQECSEIGSPVFFLALKHADGRAVLESIWAKDEMAKAIREL